MTKGNRKIAKTATEALKILWEEDYFNTWRRYGELVEVLSKRGNNFSPAELGMALKRAKHLTRKGTRTNYEYIQKYPFIKDEY